MGDMENNYKCSGMCEPGLFFFSRPLHEGPPTQTCFKKFKQELHDSAEGIAVNSVVTGVFALFIFFSHFSLYCRPQEPEEGVQQPPGDSNIYEEGANNPYGVGGPVQHGEIQLHGPEESGDQIN